MFISKPRRPNRGAIFWVACLLGLVGIVASAVALLGLDRPEPLPPAPAPAAPVAQAMAEEASIAQEKRRQAYLAEIRATREMAKREQPKRKPNEKCIGGVLYLKDGNEWKQLGLC